MANASQIQLPYGPIIPELQASHPRRMVSLPRMDAAQLELDTTLLSYSSDDFPLVSSAPSVMTKKAGLLPPIDSEGTDFDSVGEHSFTISICAPPQFLHPSLNPDSAKILSIAMGLPTNRLKFINGDSAEFSEDEKMAKTPQQLAARIKLLIIKVTEFLKTLTPKEDCPTETTGRQSLILKLLQLFGFVTYPAHLHPATPAFTSLNQHSFWILVPPASLVPLSNRGLKPTDWVFVLDFHFLDLFQVARPSESYKSVFKNLWDEFVGSATSDLPEAIEWLGNWVKLSFEAQSMSLPPWRHSSFLQLCYARGIEASTHESPFPVSCEASETLVYGFLVRQGWFFETLGFERHNQENGITPERTHIPENETKAMTLSYFEKVSVDPVPVVEERSGLSITLNTRTNRKILTMP